MEPADGLVGNVAEDDSRYAFAKRGELYLVYLPKGGTAELDLSGATGPFTVSWLDPRRRGPLQAGSVKEVRGGGKAGIGTPPADPADDWLAVVRLSPWGGSGAGPGRGSASGRDQVWPAPTEPLERACNGRGVDTKTVVHHDAPKRVSPTTPSVSDGGSRSSVLARTVPPSSTPSARGHVRARPHEPAIVAGLSSRAHVRGLRAPADVVGDGTGHRDDIRYGSDKSGAVAPNVEVTITNTLTGAARMVKSNDTGSYVPQLPVGVYRYGPKCRVSRRSSRTRSRSRWTKTGR